MRSTDCRERCVNAATLRSSVTSGLGLLKYVADAILAERAAEPSLVTGTPDIEAAAVATTAEVVGES